MPRAMRTMCARPCLPPHLHVTPHRYTHAVQSLVFNRCCSFRLSPPNPLVVMLGDLVAAGGAVGGEGAEERGPCEVVEVTADNISQYSLADVVLPLPGKDVRYPSNCTGDEYKRVLAELKIENAFSGSHVKELNLSGAYRKIVCMPQGEDCFVLELHFCHVTCGVSPVRPLSALHSLLQQRQSATAHRRRC